MSKRLISLVLLLGATMSLASCGGASPSPPSGVYGITLINHGGLMTAAPTSSPLPGGFSASSYWQPFPRQVVLIKALDGEHAGQVVAQIRSDDQGLFRVALPPGRYALADKRFPGVNERVTVHAGGYARVLIELGIFY